MTERQGGCLCGHIRFRLSAEPIGARVCWCRDCQRIAANGTVNALFPAGAIEITGTPSEFIRTAGSGNPVRRRFCPQCGCHLFADTPSYPGVVVVRVGTLDEPSSVRPAANIWRASAPAWACLDSSLPAFDGQPPRAAPPEPVRSDERSLWIAASPAQVYAALCDADRVARWWGPDGFANTIHQFDLKPGGSWLLTMHGPDGTDYPNESRFTRLVPGALFEIEHLNSHHFVLTISLQADGRGTMVHWRQTFDTVEHYQRIAQFVAAANQQNLLRLQAEVLGASGPAPD